MTVDSLSHLDRSTLRERTLQALRAAITSGEYRPGDHLGEAELATSLGVSRGTVRQALRHLQQEGLVTAGHRSMLRVTSLSLEEVRELFRVRAALEGLAASQIISSADRGAAADSLRAALARLVEPDTDFIARVDADLGFHLLLCQLSRNSVLVDTWRHLEGRLRVVIVAAGPVKFGNDLPISIIAGPCQLESRAHALQARQELLTTELQLADLHMQLGN